MSKGTPRCSTNQQKSWSNVEKQDFFNFQSSKALTK